MKSSSASLTLASLTMAAGLFASAGAFAQVPTGAPAGSTGMCKDGTYSTADVKKGACRGHKGIKDWYVATAAKPSMGASAPMAMAPSSPTATAAPSAMAPAAPMAKGDKMAARAAAPGGGAGQVWVNTKTKVYHCPTDKSYGKTKEGQYMTEDAAKTAGDRASHGKACVAA